jgi:hypothetical protein
MKHNLKFGLVVGWLALLKMSAILVRHRIFLCFHEQNKYKIRISVYCSIHNKKLDNLNVRKLQIFALTCTFLGQNGQKKLIELWVELKYR